MSFVDERSPLLETESTPEELDSVYGTTTIEESTQREDKGIRVLWCNVPSLVVNATLSVLTVAGSVGMVVTLPLYSNSVICAGGDPYSVLFFTSFWFQVIFLLVNIVYKYTVDRDSQLLPTAKWWVVIVLGFLGGLNGLLSVYASPTYRTPAYLQAILPTTVILYSVVCRYLILKKGTSIRRLFCLGAVLIGLFITAEPTVFGIDSGGNSGGNSGGPEVSEAARILWPCVFALGFVPVAISYVLTEKELKRDEVESLSFMTWTSIVQFITLVLLFPTDFIPNFGMATGFDDFWDRFEVALYCHFGAAPPFNVTARLHHGAAVFDACPTAPDVACSDVALRSWLFILVYVVANLFVTLLTRYAEGAVYTSIVTSLQTPLGAIWWACLFAQAPFGWDPRFDQSAAFTLGGLAIMTPAVIVYNFFSIQEARQEEMERRLVERFNEALQKETENSLGEM